LLGITVIPMPSGLSTRAAIPKRASTPVGSSGNGVATPVRSITYGGYLPNPTDDQLLKIGRDPFLMSYALKDLENRCIVTTEISKPKSKDANRRIPDVCKDFGILCINNFQMIKEMNFSTRWSS
jgi:hypothetical protein